MVTKFITAKESDKVMHKVMLLRIKIDNKLILQKKNIQNLRRKAQYKFRAL